MSTGRPHHYGHLFANLKRMSSTSDFKQLFHDLINVYSRRSGAYNPRGQNFDVNRNILSLRSFVASKKKISLKSDFVQFFRDFVQVYSPGAEADSPPWDKVLMSTEMSCHFIHLLQV